MTDSKKLPNATSALNSANLPPVGAGRAGREFVEELLSQGADAPVPVELATTNRRFFAIDAQKDFIGDVHGEDLPVRLLGATLDAHGTGGVSAAEMLGEKGSEPGRDFAVPCSLDETTLAYDGEGARNVLRQAQAGLWPTHCIPESAIDPELLSESMSATLPSQDGQAAWEASALAMALADGGIPLFLDGIPPAPSYEGTISDLLGTAGAAVTTVRPEASAEFFALLRSKAAVAGIPFVVISPFGGEPVQLVPAEEPAAEESQSARNLTRIVTNMTQR